MSQRTELQFEDRMSQSDSLMLMLESDPVLRSTIVSAWVLDRAPDRERMDQNLAYALEVIPRLRQRVVPDPLGIAPPRWEEDPNFDIGFHVRRVRVPEPGGTRELLDLAQPIAMQSFDMDRPLWEIHLVEGLEGGRTAAIMKLHHAISDGMGLVRMTECLIERGPEPSERRKDFAPAARAKSSAKPESGLLGRIAEAASHRLRSNLDLVGQVASAIQERGPNALRHPLATWEAVSETLSSVGRLLTPPEGAMSPIMNERSTKVHFEALQIPLEELKRAGKRVGGSVNDAFVAAISGGLSLYHEAEGAPVDALRMMMPINVRNEDNETKMGNQFAPVRFELPVSIADPAERMRAIRTLVHGQRNEAALPFMEDISGVLGGLPAPIALWLIGEGQKATDFTTSNVPGPRRPSWMAGARVEGFYPFGPLAGAGANFTVFSYDGTMYVGANLDPAAVKDPALLMECLNKSVQELLSLA